MINYLTKQKTLIYYILLMVKQKVQEPEDNFSDDVDYDDVSMSDESVQAPKEKKQYNRPKFEKDDDPKNKLKLGQFHRFQP